MRTDKGIREEKKENLIEVLLQVATLTPQFQSRDMGHTKPSQSDFRGQRCNNKGHVLLVWVSRYS